jgi:NNP family nitrate/nitrite transporter-like MFS transporter
MNIPLIGILGVLAWRLTKVKFLNATQLSIVLVFLVALYLFQAYKAWDVNKDLMTGKKRYPAEDRYEFSQVAILDLTYGNRIFFQTLGVAVLVVAFLCAFFLKEPKGSFATHHEGEEVEIAAPSRPIVLDQQRN